MGEAVGQLKRNNAKGSDGWVPVQGWVEWCMRVCSVFAVC